MSRPVGEDVSDRGGAAAEDRRAWADDRRRAMAAAHAVALRTPLARVQLAASQLERDAVTPHARRLALAIAEAVAELDTGITETLSVLVPPAPPATDDDVAVVLETLRQRVAPSLRARGVTWEPGPPAEAPVPGNASWVREAAAVLAREAVVGVGAGGRLRIALVEGTGRLGLRLELEPAVAAPSLPGARALALRRGGVLEMEDGHGRATLWLPRIAEEGDPCVAS
jgi:signal transduction histidine kinase